MNERIRELAEQSLLVTREGDKLVTGWMEYVDLTEYIEYVDLTEYIEKFAELIVRECINEIHVADVGELKGKSYYLDKVAEHIEKHFGVDG